MSEERGVEDDWTPDAVQQLRARMGLSQAELAARVGTRQQTISEWETGTRTPRRMSRKLLHLVAEESGLYEVRADRAATAPPLDAGARADGNNPNDTNEEQRSSEHDVPWTRPT